MRGFGVRVFSHDSEPPQLKPLPLGLRMFDWPKILKRFWPAIILALALLLIVDGTISSLETCHPPNSASNGQNSDKDCTVLQGPLISLIVGIGDFVGDHDKGIVAAFTAILALSTIGLWTSTINLYLSGEKQIRSSRQVAAIQAQLARQQLRLAKETAERQAKEIQDQIKIARDGAIAAKRSADAVVSVELPILIMDFANLTAPGIATFGPKTPIPAKFRPIFRFTNFGRSPAQITAGCLEWIIVAKGTDLPLPPSYQRIFPYSNNVVLIKDAHIPLDVPSEISLSAEQVITINEARHFLWFYGFIAYRDFLGEPHEVRFCIKWAPFREGENGPFGFVWDSETPAEYIKKT
jgi:hypothetical protein